MELRILKYLRIGRDLKYYFILLPFLSSSIYDICIKWSLSFYLFLYLAALGLHCCAQAFSSCRERELLFLVVRGLLTAVASLVAEHGL